MTFTPRYPRLACTLVLLLSLCAPASAQCLPPPSQESKPYTIEQLICLGLIDKEPPRLHRAVGDLLEKAAQHKVRAAQFLPLFLPKGVVSCQRAGTRTACTAHSEPNTQPEGVEAATYSWLEDAASKQPIQERFNLVLREGHCVDWSDVHLLLAPGPRKLIYRSGPDGQADRNRPFFLEKVNPPNLLQGLFHMEAIERHAAWLDHPETVSAPAQTRWNQGCFQSLELVQGDTKAVLGGAIDSVNTTWTEQQVFDLVKKTIDDRLAQRPQLPGAFLARFGVPVGLSCIAQGDPFNEATEELYCEFSATRKEFEFSYYISHTRGFTRISPRFREIKPCINWRKLFAALEQSDRLIFETQNGHLPSPFDETIFYKSLKPEAIPRPVSVTTIEHYINSLATPGWREIAIGFGTDDSDPDCINSI